jgi:hypothetical protein
VEEYGICGSHSSEAAALADTNASQEIIHRENQIYDYVPGE